MHGIQIRMIFIDDAQALVRVITAAADGGV